MLRTLKWALLAVMCLLGGAGVTALADYAVTQGTGTTIFAFTCFSTKVCPTHVNTNAAGTEVFTSAVPGQVTGANGTFPVTVADGSDATQGAKADAVCSTATGTCSIAALIKFLNNSVTSGIPTQASTVAIGGVGLLAGTTGGCTGGVLLTAASNNSTSIKASAGTLCELTVANTTTTLVDVRLYDTASAPTCSSATGIVANYPIQSNAVAQPITIHLGPYGKAFPTGIGICVTGANANNDNTNAVTGINVNYAFK